MCKNGIVALYDQEGVDDGRRILKALTINLFCGSDMRRGWRIYTSTLPRIPEQDT